MAHAQKPNFVFRRNGRVHFNRQGRQFSRLLAAEVCASAVVMLDTPCSEVVWKVLATHSIRQFPLHFPFLASRCVITFQLVSTSLNQRCAPHLKRCVQHSRCLRSVPSAGLVLLPDTAWPFTVTSCGPQWLLVRQNVSCSTFVEFMCSVLLYFCFFSTSFHFTFLSDGIAISIIGQVIFVHCS